MLGVSTALMLALSWPLWIGSHDFPMVPFVEGFPQGSRFGLTYTFYCLLGAILLGAFSRSNRQAGQLAAVGILFVLVLQDQHRFQPWIYLYVVVTCLDVLLSRSDFVRASRLWYIGIYIHSGLSKLDVGFRDELGTVLLNTALGPLGIDCTHWTVEARTAVILAFPALEIVIGLLLWLPLTRPLGVFSARLFHLSLIALLGPLGLNHSTILLTWNLAMFFQVGFLFSGKVPEPEGRVSSRFQVTLSRGVAVFLVVGLVAPLGERSGWFDAWPAHALYASHPERLLIYVHEDEVADYPAEVRKHLQAGSPWRPLDLTGWSREVRGTPVYPRNRANLGLAEALASWGGRNRLVKVVEWSTANRWTNSRERAEYTGVELIRLRGRRFLLNAAPYLQPDLPR